MENNVYSIQDFVVRTLESFGALIEQKGYALIEALVPDFLAEKFNGRNLLNLAFDYEVARENRDSEFVTFGSFILHEVTELALSKGRAVEFFIPVERLDLAPRIEEMLRESVYFAKCRPPRLKNWFFLEHCYYNFNFHCVYHSDENQEEILPVLVDMSTGRQDDEVQELLCEMEKVLPAEKRQHILPQAPVISDGDAYAFACAAAKPRISDKMERISAAQAVLKNREMARVSRFYEDTIKDLEKKLAKTQDEKRIARIKQQIEAARADKIRRCQDVEEKYSVNAEVFLDSIVIYRLPKLHLNLEIQQKDEFFEFEVLYNTLSRKIETPLCPRCGRPASSLMREGKAVHCGCRDTLE